ncbi:class I SAM-dependent methyltransferase [Pseudonocardia sp. GCM10023141]|uniref:class I SAM-dependent methyltransferase n=1 Tax=Pseudonocardia sp. GCM10023141 TaxID=3252653 RepID=UPI0036083B4F
MEEQDRLGYVCGLYRKYSSDLVAVVEQQRTFRIAARGRMTPQLDDLEAEITYLLLRDRRPATVMELGTFHGWSTTWLLSALRDNGTGRLHSFDKIDNVVRQVPADLAADRWTFVQGDMKANLAAVPADVDYLFVDADHGQRFGDWYLEHLFPLMPAGIPVSVHDVFRGRRARIWSEGAVVVSWLQERGVRVFSASRKNSPAVFAEINRVRAELGIEGARGTTRNPMIFFNLP